MADSVDQIIYSYLTSDSTFMADFNSVHWVEAPEGTTYPYIVYWLVTDTGEKTYLGKLRQGEAAIQFDLWDDNRIRGARLRGKLRDKVDDLNDTLSGYALRTIGVTEQTLQRASGTDPYHFVVDGIIQWQEN